MRSSNKETGDKKWIYITVAVCILLIAIMSMSMVNVTVLDPQALENITIHVNIT